MSELKAGCPICHGPVIWCDEDKEIHGDDDVVGCCNFVRCNACVIEFGLYRAQPEDKEEQAVEAYFAEWKEKIAEQWNTRPESRKEELEKAVVNIIAVLKAARSEVVKRQKHMDNLEMKLAPSPVAEFSDTYLTSLIWQLEQALTPQEDS